MSKVLKTNLQVVLVSGKDKKVKTLTNAIAQVSDEQAKKLGEIMVELAPNDAHLEHVKSVETKSY